MKPPAKQIKEIRTMPMKRVAPNLAPKLPRVIAKAASTEVLVEELRARVNELEARLVRLENAISVQGQDVVISAPGNVLVQAGNAVEVSAAVIRESAGMSEANVGMVKVTGVVQCETLIAQAVISASYTPGAGNVW